MSNKKDIFKDERFAHLLSNPRFKKLPTKEGKVKIDERFKPMFENDKFNIQYNVDKYGRKVNKKSGENLKNYYDLDSNESSDEEKAQSQQGSDEEVIPGNAAIKGGNNLPEKLKDKLKNMEIDYIRGEGVLQSDSSDEEESSNEEEVDVQHDWGELDKDAERTEESTRRVACLNMDWDRIRAVDIMILCNSFISTGAGSVLSVNIYPSEFGKERLAEEEVKGPKEITTFEAKNDENEDNEEDEKYTEKLREYQLNRLKYYYAVVEFDSEKSADIVYKECDGLEYESTANRLDLRFIPDEMEFDDEPKDSCTELPDLSKYEPRIFFTTALQHAKVELTWDETDVGRQEISDKLFSDKRNEISDRDLRKFVAFSSESENDDDQDESNSDSDNVHSDSKSGKSKMDLYKALLDEVNQKEQEKKKQQVEMEYSWGIGSLDKMEKVVPVEKEEELTPFEKILEKKKQKKKAKKEQRKKKLKGDDDENENGHSSSDFDDIDMNDPYFAEEFANGDFKMPNKKGSKKKKHENAEDNPEADEKLKAQKELELLLEDNEEEKSHFSLKKIQENEDMSSSKKKRKLKKLKKQGLTEEPVDNFELNVKDDRFKAVFSQPEFNIDPTNSGYKKTKGMEKLIQEKLKRRHTDDVEHTDDVVEKKKKIKDVSLNLLVKNIKRKAGK